MSTKLTDLSLRFFLLLPLPMKLEKNNKEDSRISQENLKKMANNKAKSNQIDTSPLRIQIKSHSNGPFASSFFESLFSISESKLLEVFGSDNNKGTKRAEILFSRQDTREDSSAVLISKFHLQNTQKE